MKKNNVYSQLVEDYKKEIDLGLLKEHQRLPSCRETALRLGINPNTVQKAHAALESEGYVYCVPQKGVFVAPRDKALESEKTAKEQIRLLKAAGIDRQTLIKIVEEIYGDDDDTNN